MSDKTKASETSRSGVWWKHLGIAALILGGTLAVVSAARHVLRPSLSPLPSDRDLVEYHPPQVHVTTASQLELALKARNPWAEPVQILKVVPSCSCTVAELPQGVIAPGQEVAFRLRLSVPPTGFPARRLSVTFLLDRQRSWTHEVVLRVLRPVVVRNPCPRGPEDTFLDRLDFGTLKLRQSVHRRWSVQGYAVQPDQVPQVLQVWCHHPQVRVRLLGRRGADSSEPYLAWTDTLQVSIDAATRPGAFAADVELHGRLGDTPFRKHLYVTWQVEPVFRLEPDQVVFVLSARAKRQHEVRIIGLDRRRFALHAPKQVPDWLRLHGVRWGHRAAEHRLRLEVIPEAVKQDSSCRLRLGTDHPRQPTLEIPCAAVLVIAEGGEYEKPEK